MLRETSITKNKYFCGTVASVVLQLGRIYHWRIHSITIDTQVFIINDLDLTLKLFLWKSITINILNPLIWRIAWRHVTELQAPPATSIYTYVNCSRMVNLLSSLQTGELDERDFVQAAGSITECNSMNVYPGLASLPLFSSHHTHTHLIPWRDVVEEGVAGV